MLRPRILNVTYSFKSFSTVPQPIAIDCHTHMYTPKYMNILRKRTNNPRVISHNNENRLLILPGEEFDPTTSAGRRIGNEYYDVNCKLNFMKANLINQSIISLANPWFDFLDPREASSVAQELNDELQSICELSNGNLLGFASLPVKNKTATLSEIYRLKSLSHIKGFILGTTGAGAGLDHEDFREVLGAIEQSRLPIFLHPHYGVGNEHFHDSGHSLFLALGFPFETTVCISRLIVTGTLDHFPKLKILVAHAGAALPALIGRLDSCVAHDLAVANRIQKEPSAYLRDMYFDAISYGVPQLQSLISQVGEDSIVFGTDNPFFPPPCAILENGLQAEAQDISSMVWPSTKKVHETIQSFNPNTAEKILRGNARKLFGIFP